MRQIARHIAPLALFFFAACGGAADDGDAPADPAASEPSEPAVVTSDDGLATLTISRESLPDGLKASDITVTHVAPKDDPGGVAYYRLAPDGVQFRKPITATVTLPSGKGSLPVLWLVSSNGKAEPLSSVKVSLDASAGKTVVTTEIPHFSQLAAAYGFFDVAISDPGTIAGRDIFPVTVDVTRSADQGHVMTAVGDDGVLFVPTISIVTNGKPGPAVAGYIRVTSESFAMRQGTFRATFPVSPDKIDDAPGYQADAGGVASVTRMFQCAKGSAGGMAATISHDAYIEFSQELDTFALPPGAGPGYVPPAGSLTPEPSKTGTTKLVYDISTDVSCKLQPPKVKAFAAQFSPEQKSTFYTVTAEDPSGGPLSYAWAITNKCGQFNASDAPTAEWHHPDVEGGCPDESVHPGEISVVVTGPGGQVTCYYEGGSASGYAAQCVKSQ